MEHVIAAGDFKAKCLRLLDEVTENREPWIITKHGRAVAQLVPLPIPENQDLFGVLAGTVISESNILSPLENEWDACQ